jgi:hypothetical protein
MATRRTTDPTRTIPTLQPEAPAQTQSQPRKRAPKSAAPPPVAAQPPTLEVSADARRGMIAEAAYLRAERRGFAPGYELEDWIAAENEVDSLLDAEHGRHPQ